MKAALVPVEGQPDRVALVMSKREARELIRHFRKVARDTDDVYENRPYIHGVAAVAAFELNRALNTKETAA